MRACFNVTDVPKPAALYDHRVAQAVNLYVRV